MLVEFPAPPPGTVQRVSDPTALDLPLERKSKFIYAEQHQGIEKRTHETSYSHSFTKNAHREPSPCVTARLAALRRTSLRPSAVEFVFSDRSLAALAHRLTLYCKCCPAWHLLE